MPHSGARAAAHVLTRTSAVLAGRTGGRVATCADRCPVPFVAPPGRNEVIMKITAATAAIRTRAMADMVARARLVRRTCPKPGWPNAEIGRAHV